jgi:RNA polymerase sigma-70 factor (ECF subfamily)
LPSITKKPDVTKQLEVKGRRHIDELFELIKLGDQKALELLFAIYFPRLNDFACKVVRDDVISQDIVQEVFVKIWEKRAEIEPINLEAFLFRLVRNRCIDYIKHLKVINNRMQEIQISSKYEELYRIDFVGDEPYVLIEQELKQKIEKTIDSLPERCREVFILSRMNGLKNKEIAEKLDINIKNVERHLSRAMQSFRENFTEELPLAIVILVLKSLDF